MPKKSEAARVAATETVTDATALLAEARRAAETESEGLGGQRAAAAAATERRRGTAAELRRMEAEFADLASRVERHRLELVEMTERIAALRSQLPILNIRPAPSPKKKKAKSRKLPALTSPLEEARQQSRPAGRAPF